MFHVKHFSPKEVFHVKHNPSVFLFLGSFEDERKRRCVKRDKKRRLSPPDILIRDYNLINCNTHGTNQ